MVVQTLEFTRALKIIVAELKVNELIALLQTWLIPDMGNNPPLSEDIKDRFSDLVLDSHSGYDRLSAFESTGKILLGLDIKEFYDPGRIRRLITSLSGMTNISQVRTNPEMYAFFEKLKSLQRISETCTGLLETEKLGTLETSHGIVEIELVDYDGNGIEPERLKALAVIIRELHTNLSQVFQIEGDQLRFKYFDSGSPVKIGIECAKAIAESIGSLLLQYWDKIMFHKFDTFDRRIEAASKGLTFIETVKEKVETKVITEEVGNNLTHRVLTEIDDLIGIGAIIPPAATVTVDQRALLLERRDVKLLESGKTSTVDDSRAT